MTAGRRLAGLAAVLLLGGAVLWLPAFPGRYDDGHGTWFLIEAVLILGGLVALATWNGFRRGAPAWSGPLAVSVFEQLAKPLGPNDLPRLDPDSVGMPSPDTLAIGVDEGGDADSLSLGTVRLGDSFDMVKEYVAARNAALAPAWARHVDSVLSRPMPADAALRASEVLADAFADRVVRESGGTESLSLVPDKVAIARAYTAVLASTFPQFMAAMKRRDAIAKDNRQAEIADQVDIAERAIADPVNYTADAVGYVHHIHRRTHDRTYLDAIVPAVLPVLDEAPHAYITGGTGSGKSELLKNLALEYALRDDAAVVLIDPHGSLASALARREEFAPGGPLADRLVYIDPALGEGHAVPTLNPLETTDRSPRAIQVLSEQLTSAFEEVLGVRQGAAFTVNMINVLGEGLRALMLLGDRTLGDLRRLLADDPALVDACRQVSDDPDVDFFGVQFRKEQIQPAKESLAGKLKGILAGNRHLFVGKSTVDLEALTAQRKVIIFNLSKGTIGPLSSEALGRFIVAHLCSMALRQERAPPRLRTRVRLLIDECHHYVGPSIATILAETRKYELRVVLCQQYAGQEMSADFRQAILANTPKKLCGRNDDLATLRAMAEAMRMDVDSLRSLPQFAFAVRWGARRPFTMRARTDRLGSSGDMDDEQWDAVRAEQLALYYRPVQVTQRVDPKRVILPATPLGVDDDAGEPPPL